MKKGALSKSRFNPKQKEGYQKLSWHQKQAGNQEKLKDDRKDDRKDNGWDDDDWDQPVVKKNFKK